MVSIGVLALIGVLLLKMHPSDTAPDLNSFVLQSARADEIARERIAQTYLQTYTASELLNALENADRISCHTKAHPIGRAVYARTKNLSDSIAQCGSTCGDGCFHGALMEMFSSDSDTLGGVINEEAPEAYIAHVRAAAKDLCAQPEVADSVLPSFCLHGLGHVFAYVSDYDLAGSIESCSIFQGDARKPCVSGVYMEYMSAEKNTGALSEKSFSPCTAGEWSRFCFRFKGESSIAAWGSVPAALEACQTLTRELRSQCIAGIGFAKSTKDMFATASGPDSVCGTLTGEDKRSCVQGAMMQIAVSEPILSNAVCDRMDAAFRTLCVDSLAIDRHIRAD